MVHLVKARYRLNTMGMITMRNRVTTAGAGYAKAWRRSMKWVSARKAVFKTVVSVLVVQGRVCPRGGREQIPAI
jgi:hypothetical protein